MKGKCGENGSGSEARAGCKHGLREEEEEGKSYEKALFFFFFFFSVPS